MAKLHELLAVESDLEKVYGQILEETRTNFTKHTERYFGFQQRVELFDEEAPDEPDQNKEMDDTVPRKLEYTAEHVVRYLDAVLQKEKTNQTAVGDIVVDGTVIAKDVPATFLLGLENKLKNIRDKVYKAIPTLQPGVKWERDESLGADVYKKAYPDEKFRTKKVRKNHVLAEATEKHPAQVEVYTEDEKVARLVTNTWCGMISSAEKSALLGRIDKLLYAVKKARQRANMTKVVDTTIGKELFEYICG